MRERIFQLFVRLGQSAGRPIDVLGQGECSQDRVLRLPGRLSTLAPLFSDPQSGGKLIASSLDRVGGGQVATALCAASRLGYRCVFAGVVGDDSDGREVLAGLQAEGIDTTATTVLPQIPTRTALILVDEHGDRVVLEHRHPSLLPHPDQPSLALLGQTRIVHVDATFPAAARRTLRAGRAAGALTSLDLDRDTPDAVALLSEADLAIVAAHIPPRLTGLADIEAAACALARTLPGLLIVTLGEAGSLLALPDGEALICHRQAAFPAVAGAGLLDTTACGDTYRAALLCALLEAAPSSQQEAWTAFQRAMRAGSAAAALKCRDLGRRGCPGRAELAAHLAQSPFDAADLRDGRDR